MTYFDRFISEFTLPIKRFFERLVVCYPVFLFSVTTSPEFAWRGDVYAPVNFARAYCRRYGGLG